MCGFVGFIEDDSSFDRAAVIKAMADTIAHRGPDSEGYFVDDHAALGFRRLSIIDLEGANQPLFNEDGRFVLCMNGEVYNYQNLRAELREAGHLFTTDGDAEVILHGYEEWGPAVLPRLRGMFAFALYDRETGDLFCARDPFGIKPFYYNAEEGHLLFASEIKGMLPYPNFNKRLNVKRLPQYLCTEYQPDAETLFEGVYKLPAGHSLFWHDGAFAIERWFTPSYAPEEGRSMDEQAKRIEDILRDSVAAHAIADVEVGCFLSAGVDSSLVANEVSKIMDAKTFTIGYGEQKYSELAKARAFADAVGLANNARTMDAQEFFDAVGAIQYAMDEPLPNPSAVPLYYLCRFASESVKVVMSGEGADEFFGGYPYYQECLAYEPYMKVPAPLRRALGAVASHLPAGTHGRRFLMRGAHPLRERDIRIEYDFTFSDACDLLNPSLPIDRTTPPWKAFAYAFDGTQGEDEVTAMQTADLLTWMQQDILLKADKMSMAASLELRVPFLDKEVFSVARTLPTYQRVNREQTKLALRAAAARTLPPVTAEMPKVGFMTPLVQWLTEEPWRSRVREAFNSETAKQFFQIDKLNSLLDGHTGPEHSNMKKIWSAFCFIVWYDEYFVKR